ncbi:putative lipopolysaccharide biosynthesis protein [unidentified eubacterium SCB49]|nr:putative lipopolysaccharide biosynthesis protein [unidentified eubacterium SCB49]
MKVLQIINSLATGGAEKLLLEQIPIYNKMGFVVDLLVLDGTKHPFLDELIKQQCCNVYSLGASNVYNPFLVFKIIPYFKKYDIVHVHLFPALYWVSLAKKISFSKVKLVYTEHSTTNTRRKRKFYRLIDKFIYKSYTHIITIASEVDINLKNHLRTNLNKYVLINNGVNTSLFNSAAPYPKSDFFSDNDIILIQVSSFRWQKDQLTLIRSLTLLPNNVKLLLVGDGDLKNELQLEVEKLNLSDRVKFLGNRIDVPRLLKTADIVILSSHHEGLSLASIEGMASGKPFISSEVPGLTEVVNGAGLMFEKENEVELSNHILALIKDENYYNAVVKKCLERSRQYDIKKMIDSYILLYKSIL